MPVLIVPSADDTLTEVTSRLSAGEIIQFSRGYAQDKRCRPSQPEAALPQSATASPTLKAWANGRGQWARIPVIVRQTSANDRVAYCRISSKLSS